MATMNGTDLVTLFVTPTAIVPNAGDKEVGAKLLFIPPYSPDLNPIELAFSKLKARLRAKALRTADALWKALGTYAAASVPQSAPIASATTAISSQRENALTG